eukprot:gene19834-25782_t
MSFGSKINLQLNLPTDDINAACSYISNPKEILFATWDKDKTKQLSDSKFLLSFPLILLPGLGNIQPEIEVSMIYNNQRIILESGNWTIRATSGAIMKDSRFLSTFDIKLRGQLSLVPPTNQLSNNRTKYLQAVGWVEYKVQGSKPKFFRNAPNFVLDNTINIIQTMANDYATSVFVSRFTRAFREFMFKKFSKKSEDKDKLPSITNINGPENEELGIQGNNFSKSKKQDEINEDRSLKPPPQFGGDNEMKQLAASISREIYQESPNVRFSDIISLNEAKRLLCEAIQLPLKYPNIFVGILRPWRGILLHGPPGTGKTMLAKAVATECKTTFFNISASSLVSKWRGDSEKLVRVLFELARYHAPSTIFLDEIDSILTSRGGEGQEHEASRRMKTELLIQMDGVKGNVNNSSTKSIDQVFVMAASNLPWDLDIAVLRRLEKRVLVGIPTKEARETMLKKHLSDRSSNDFDFSKISDLTNGYSGADIELLCREAAMMPVRRLMIKINALDENKLTIEPPQPPVTNKSLNTNRNIISKVSISSSSLTIDPDTLIKSDPVTMDDILNALDTTRPSSDGNMMKYEAWQQEYGSS